MYTAQVFIPPLIPLFMGYVIVVLFREGRFSKKAMQGLLTGLAALFVLACVNSWAGMQAVDRFRALQANEILALHFYNEAQGYARCRPNGNEMAPVCLEQSVSDPHLIRQLVQTFPNLSAYSPNHEGAKERYLLQIRLKTGKSQWLILGKGNRYLEQTTWLEFNSGIRDGMHYGVYLNEKLYHVLNTQLKLQKWQKK